MKRDDSRRQRLRAVAAVANGRQTLRQIARRASVSRGTLVRWIQDPELRAEVRAQNDLYDLWLRARIRGLMPHALRALKKMLSSPNASWQAKSWAITMIMRLNDYLDDVADGTGHRYATARHNVRPLNAAVRGRRRGRLRRLVDARPEVPPAQSLPG